MSAGEEVVGLRDDRPEVLLDELRVVADRLGHGAEDDADLGELSLKRRDDGNGVEDRVDRDVHQALLLGERDAELLEGREQIRVNLVEATRSS